MYQLIKFNDPVWNGVRRLSDMASIPFDPDNTDYQQFLKYQAEGGKVYGADEEIPDGQTS
jgi:hypothetical protein